MPHEDLDTLLDTLPACETVAPFDRLAKLASAPDRTTEELQRIFATVDLFFQYEDKFFDRPRIRAHPRICERAERVMAAIAAHPDASPHVLAKVLPYGPAAFCTNPIAPLLVLEDPEWTKLVDGWMLGSLLRLPNAPASIVAAIAAGQVRDYRRKIGSELHVIARQLLFSDHPDAIDVYEDSLLSPPVREARNHIAIAPEVETVSEWLEIVRIAYLTTVVTCRWQRIDNEDSRYLDLYRHTRSHLFRLLSKRDRRSVYWKSWWYRLGVAEAARPLTGRIWLPQTKHLLQLLSQDGHRLVRAAARFRLAEPERIFDTELRW